MLWRSWRGCFHLIPIYITLTVAFKPKTDLSSRWLLPVEPYLGNFHYAIKRANVFLAMGNSCIITILSIAVIVAVGAMAAYPLSRNTSPLNRRIMQFILAVMMVPPLSMLVPLVTVMTRMGAVSTYWGIVLVLGHLSTPSKYFPVRELY